MDKKTRKGSEFAENDFRGNNEKIKRHRDYFGIKKASSPRLGENMEEARLSRKRAFRFPFVEVAAP